LQPEISSFRLQLAAEGKAAKTIRTCTEAVQWFAAARLLHQTGRTCWEDVRTQDVQEWMVWLLDRYSPAYASNQFRSLQQFFKWLATEEDIPDPMTGLRPPLVPEKPVPVFTGEDLARLERSCAGRSFQQRRDAAIIAILLATGIRLSELAALRCHPGDPRASDVDVWQREITVHGKGRRTRIVKIGHGTARALDRYLRARARHGQAWRPQLWLGTGSRGPMTASGIYQVIARRGRQCGIDAFPHRFRHHFSHTWLDRGGAEGDLMELNGWTSPQMLRRYGRGHPAARPQEPAACRPPGSRRPGWQHACCRGRPGCVRRRAWSRIPLVEHHEPGASQDRGIQAEQTESGPSGELMRLGYRIEEVGPRLGREPSTYVLGQARWQRRHEQRRYEKQSYGSTDGTGCIPQERRDAESKQRAYREEQAGADHGSKHAWIADLRAGMGAGQYRLAGEE
jgi:integrase/recombinase XerD